MAPPYQDQGYAHIVAHATELGLSRTTGATLIAAIGATTILGRVSIRFIADRIDRTRVFAVCSALMGVSTLALPFLQTKLPSSTSRLGSASATTGTARYSARSPSIGLSGLGAPYLAARGYETVASYAPAFAAAGIAAIAGSGLLFVIDDDRGPDYGVDEPA